MKISELNDDDIFDFLMVSEFEGDYSPTELKFLLLKWRYFYRVFYGRSEQSKLQLESIIAKLEEEIKIRTKREYDLMVESADKQNTIDQIKTRKLTFRERWRGEIILDDTDKNKTNNEI